MIVVVGHGPSIVGKGMGPWIDRQTVIRLKGAPMPNPDDWGTRTDVISTTKQEYLGPVKAAEYWLFGPEAPGFRHPDVERWIVWFNQFRTKLHKRAKPSNGLCAIFAAVEFLKPKTIALIGFDSILRPDQNSGKWHDPNPPKWSHDQKAENAALHQLGVEIVEC